MEPRDGNQDSRSGSTGLSVGRRNGHRTQPEHGDSRRTAGKPTLRVALVDVGQEHREILQQVCLSVGYSPIFRHVLDAFADGLNEWGDLIVVESDLGFDALRLAERARRFRTSPVGVLLNWWSDLEWEAHQAVDFVLHVPLTPDEVRGILTSTLLRSWDPGTGEQD
jgi:hypothetical protein